MARERLTHKATRGFTAVVARSREGNVEIARKLRRLGIRVVEVDTIRIIPYTPSGQINSMLRHVNDFDWVGFTSAVGASEFVKRMNSLGVHLVRGKPRFAAVGPGTARRLRIEGIRVSYIPSIFITSELAQGFPRNKGRRVLLLRSEAADSELPRLLARRGLHVTDMPIYGVQTVRGPILKQSIARDADFVVFASPSEVNAFTKKVGNAAMNTLTRGVIAACIGPVTAKAALGAGFKTVITPANHTINDLVALVNIHAKTLSRRSR